MLRRALGSAVLALAVIIGAPAAAQAATASASGTIAASPVCQVNHAAVPAAAAELKLGLSAKTVCGGASAVLTESGASLTPAASAAESGCGKFTYSMRANDPSKGKFHEDVEWEDLDPYGTGDITAAWANYSTGASNNYTWDFVFVDSVDYDRDVNSGAGLIGGYEFGDAVLPNGTVCSGGTPIIYVNVS
jgi:hypothetical protein